jgi:DNA-binding CsgD family transcriptional regulator
MAGEIVGRGTELAAIGGFVEGLSDHAGCLLLVGEPGIGKTTLWRAACERAEAAGFRVLSSRPAETEAKLSFAGLTDLLAGVDSAALASLPAPQRHALGVVLLEEELGPRPLDQRALFSAFVSVLALLAEDTPVVVGIDDLQWLDAPSQAALEFAVRRLGGRRVGLLASVRIAEGVAIEPSLARTLGEASPLRIEVGPLSPAALHTLIRDALGHSFPRPTLLRVAHGARGNPFYTLEIARALVRGERRPGETLPVPDDVSRLVADRVEALPKRTRAALVAAAALASPTVELVGRTALAPAEAAGLVEVTGERVSFAHPLFASAVSASVSVDERRRVHRRLAAQLADPEERARHLALASDGPDEEIAAALDVAAGQARSRGAPDAAAELNELAWSLTPAADAERASSRALAAAGDHFHAGDLDRARTLAERVLESTSHGRLRGHALRILGEICYHGNSFPEAVPLLEEALAELGDDPAVVELHVDLAFVYWNLGDMQASAPHGHAAAALAERIGDDGLTAVALAASVIVDFYLDEPLDRTRIERALALEDYDRQVVMPLRPSLLAGIVEHLNDELEAALERFTALRRRTIDRGEESDLPLLDTHLALLERRRGNLVEALAYANEGDEIARILGTPAASMLVLAERCYCRATAGDVAGARADADEGLELARGAQPGFATIWLGWALAFLELELGNPAAAFAALEPIVVVVERVGACGPDTATVVPDAVEALIALGELERAESLTDALERHGRRHDRPSILARAARCQALILAARGDPEGAEAAIERALAEHDRLRMPLELGRTLLIAGLVHRRARRKRAARESLESAVATFDRTGAAVWAETARAELWRVGRRTADRSELSATEEEIARLAATGLTNREIAERAFVSPKTVEGNLARVYRKLGIHSRAELGRAMAEREWALTE